MTTAALIVACGATYRRDSFAPLRKVGSISAAQRLILTFRRVGAAPIVIISGQDADKLEKNAARLGAVFLRNDQGQAEMFDSVRLGLSYLQDKCDQVLITPVDVPLFSAETLKALLAFHYPLANPVFAGKKGHPLLLSQTLFDQVLAYQGAGGLRAAVNSTGIAPQLIEVADPGVVLDLEDAIQADDLVASHSVSQLRPELKLRLAKDVVCFGPGTEQLLTLIISTDSVRLACQQMGISYSKGWKMLAVMEEQLGFTVVARQQGGKAGGEAHLTPRGKELLERYQQFARDSRIAVEEIFQRYFPS